MKTSKKHSHRSARREISHLNRKQRKALSALAAATPQPKNDPELHELYDIWKDPR